MGKPAIYLDVNAGARVHPVVSEALRELLQDPESLGSNPSSIHSYGRKARARLIEAKDCIALSLGASAEDLVFTSSGTEANQTAIRSAFESLGETLSHPHWITTPVEHDCNRKMQDWVRERGGEISVLEVDQAGAPVASSLAKLIRPETALVSCIWVNNETGVISDIAALARECERHGIPLHVDAAQAWGKVPVRLEQLGVTYACFSAHKVGALAGTGVLYVKRGARLCPLIGGKQERARRGGTENLLGIVAAGVAASHIDLERGESLAELRDRLQSLIQNRIAGTLINGANGARVGNTLSLCFEGVETSGLIEALDLEGFAVSSGSACSSGIVNPSPVLMALGRSPGLAAAGLRVSLDTKISWAELEEFTAALERVVMRFRKTAGRKIGQNSTHVPADPSLIH